MRLKLLQRVTEIADTADIDECAVGLHDCLERGRNCTDSVGGFTCECGEGFFEDPDNAGRCLGELGVHGREGKEGRGGEREGGDTPLEQPQISGSSSCS